MGQTKSGTGLCSPQDPDTPVIPNSYFVHYHRADPKYREYIMEDKINHYGDEKSKIMVTPILARLRSHPKGAELIRKRFE
jgi:hypothetical protein